MKALLFLFAFAMIIPSVSAQEKKLTTFILVRHAEKESDGTRDPDLNEEGVSRARQLQDLLKSATVDKIISTPFKRTMNTVKGLAAEKGIKVQEYDYKNEKLLKELIKSNTGKTILISGHSNTTPTLVNKLIGEKRFEQLDESVYGNIYIVTCSKVGDGTVLLLNY